MKFPFAVEIVLEEESALVSGQKRFPPKEESRHFSSKTQGPKTAGLRTHGINVITCFKCLKEGHIAKECHLRVKCAKCGNEGHSARDC
ncbi:hypothetical protein ANN_24888 [Periplaneta americana]|uniref:CCHC-type domain-containing protein n=1 Tax=Periplaneta americana TaxID=6978 RepID=A0ABQ8S070_PERAM|nr:hypothetical protein ANN_24888 [Periplaneta americana]